VQGVALIGATILLVGTRSVVDDALGTALYILVTVLVLVGYPVAYETVTRGRSLGKAAVGLRIVSDDGGPERFRQALFRGLAGVIEIWVTSGAVAVVASLASERGKRLGDVFAGTIVISERAPQEAPAPPMPHGLESWARTLELSGLSDELANSARQFLTRVDQLAPEVQHAMGSRIAAQVASYVAPPPPSNLPPYPYLAAVLAERRRRTEVRLAAGTPPPGHTEPVPPAPPDARQQEAEPPGPEPGAPPPRGRESGFAPPD
ncbi:MAG: RDD family protein, partial [Nocardioidaceae bacterium]